MFKFSQRGTVWVRTIVLESLIGHIQTVQLAFVCFSVWLIGILCGLSAVWSVEKSKSYNHQHTSALHNVQTELLTFAPTDCLTFYIFLVSHRSACIMHVFVLFLFLTPSISSSSSSSHHRDPLCEPGPGPGPGPQSAIIHKLFNDAKFLKKQWEDD